MRAPPLPIASRLANRAAWSSLGVSVPTHVARYPAGQGGHLRRADGGRGLRDLPLRRPAGERLGRLHGARVHPGRDRPGDAIARDDRGHPGGDARVDPPGERAGAPRREGQKRDPALRQRDARQEERVAPRRVDHRAHAWNGGPPAPARGRRDSRRRLGGHAGGPDGRDQGDRRQRARRRFAARRLHRHRAGRSEHQGHLAEPGRRDRRAQQDRAREPRRHPGDARQRARHHGQREPRDRAHPRERARRDAGRAAAPGDGQRVEGGPARRAARHDRAPRQVEPEPPERPRACRQRDGPYRPRGGDHRQVDEGRRPHQRGAGCRRGRERLRAGHRAPADDRRAAQRLQLPREHDQELRRAPPPAARGQVLRHRANQRPARPHADHGHDDRHDQHDRAGALPHDHDDDDRQLPLLAAVREAHGPVHGPLRHQGVDRRLRDGHPPSARPLRDRQRPLRVR